MKRFIPAVIVGALSISGAAFAQTPPAQTAQPQATQPKAAAAKAAHNPDEVICKRQEDTGSRLGGTKICHTRSEWDEQSRIAHDEVDRAQQTVRTPS